MRFIAFTDSDGIGLSARCNDGQYRGLHASDQNFPGELFDLLTRGADTITRAAITLQNSPLIDLSVAKYLPPIRRPGKVICIGLNYIDHTLESGFEPPEYPAIFGRFNSSLIGHLTPIVRPKASEQLDYEGELVAIIGQGGRHIPVSSALEHVAGYSLFNDASIRDFQFKSTQWTVGKNFDATGAFGPQFVTADELPTGCKGLHFETKLNDLIVQRAFINDLIFDVATLVSLLSDSMTLSPGDLIVTGTPGGVGLARKPPLWMKAGDVCTVDGGALGVLKNPISDEL